MRNLESLVVGNKLEHTKPIQCLESGKIKGFIKGLVHMETVHIVPVSRVFIKPRPRKTKKINIAYILESNPQPFYSFRGLKYHMRIRIACGLDSRS